MKILVVSAHMGGRSSNKINVDSKVLDSPHSSIVYKYYDDTNFPMRKKALQPRTVGKIPKMLAWELNPGYDVYIWIDSKFNITNPQSINWYLEMLGDKEAAFFKHPYRSSVGEELDFVMNLLRARDSYIMDRYEHEDMVTQVKEVYLKDPNYIDNTLLAGGSFIYRKELVQNRDYNVMKEWFYHNCRWSVQDQLSLPYLLQKFNVNYNIIQDNIYDRLNSL